jgi:hypothetical protein
MQKAGALQGAQAQRPTLLFKKRGLDPILLFLKRSDRAVVVHSVVFAQKLKILSVYYISETGYQGTAVRQTY